MLLKVNDWTPNQVSRVIFFFALSLLLIHHFCFFYGHYGYDDLYYARLAHSLSVGSIDWMDHYSYRWAIILPTTLMYILWGISDLSSALPALMSSAVIISIFYSNFYQRPWVLLLVIMTYFCSSWPLFYSDKLMPDIHVACFSLLAWRSYERYREKGTYCFASIWFSVWLFVAFLAKGTIVIILPPFFYYLIQDFTQRQYSFWISAGGFTFLLLSIYHSVIYLLTGSAWSRYSAIDSGHYINECSYDQMDWNTLMSRISTDFLDFMIVQQLYIPLLIAGILIVIHRRRTKQVIWFYPLTIVISLLSADLMTISPTSYNPTCLDPRHFLLIIPIMAMCIGRMASSIGWLTPSLKLSILLISCLLFIRPARHMLDNKKTSYHSFKAEIAAVLKQPDWQGYHLMGNDVMNNFLDYYSQYTPKQAVVSDTIYLRSWYTDWHSSNDIDTSLIKNWEPIETYDYDVLQVYKRR